MTEFEQVNLSLKAQYLNNKDDLQEKEKQLRHKNDRDFPKFMNSLRHKVK